MTTVVANPADVVPPGAIRNLPILVGLLREWEDVDMALDTAALLWRRENSRAPETKPIPRVVVAPVSVEYPDPPEPPLAPLPAGATTSPALQAVTRLSETITAIPKAV